MSFKLILHFFLNQKKSSELAKNSSLVVFFTDFKNIMIEIRLMSNLTKWIDYI